MIHDRLPEITEEVVMTVTRAGGEEEISVSKDNAPGDAPAAKLDMLAKEIIDERRRNHQT